MRISEYAEINLVFILAHLLNKEAQLSQVENRFLRQWLWRTRVLLGLAVKPLDHARGEHEFDFCRSLARRGAYVDTSRKTMFP